MKKSLVLAVIVLAIVAALVMSQRRRAVADSARPAPAREQFAAPADNEIPFASSAEESKTPPVVVQDDQVLAQVNGVAITTRDLFPVSGTNAPATRTLTAASYQYLLDRAITRELVFQEARQRGLGLKAEQQAQLDSLEQSLVGRDGARPDDVLARPNARATLAEQIDFDRRDATGLLLQKELLTSAGVPPPYVTEAQVQAHYEQHLPQFGPLPDSAADRAAAWRRISNQIRQQLTYANLQSYQTQQTVFLERLKSQANIQVSPH